MIIKQITEDPTTNTVLLELEMSQDEHIKLLEAAVTRAMVLAIEEKDKIHEEYTKNESL
jgi:hypothetical protein